jgi:hypothetical protein
MAISNRELSLLVEDLVSNPHKIAIALKEKNWGLLLEVSKFIENFPHNPQYSPLAQTDPARFRKIMRGITECYILGWHKINRPKIKKIRKLSKKC